MKLFAKNLLKGIVFLALFFGAGILVESNANTAHAEAVTYWSDEGKRADSFAGGTGTKEDPYQIATPAQLGYLEYITDIAVDADRSQTAEEGQKDKFFKITADLDMSGASWKPIGRSNSRYTSYFRGSLDGGNHIISHLDHSLIGYFYCYAGQELKNITIKDSEFGFDRNFQETYTGGLIAYCKNSPCRLSNIHIYSNFDEKKLEKRDGESTTLKKSVGGDYWLYKCG